MKMYEEIFQIGRKFLVQCSNLKVMNESKSMCFKFSQPMLMPDGRHHESRTIILQRTYSI